MIAPATRRGLLAGAGGAAAAIGLLGTPPARAVTILPGYDADLLALCARYMALNPERARLVAIIEAEDDLAGDAAYDLCDRTVWDPQDDLAARILATPARSPAGAAAKAGVAIDVIRENTGPTDELEFQDQLAAAALSDVVRTFAGNVVLS